MERAEFESLVTRMERLATEDPAAYRRRVFGLAVLGYGYLLFVVIALAVLAALSVVSIYYLKAIGVKLVIVIGALFIAVLRSLWVKLSPPIGERITRADAPDLFRLLDELRQRLRTPSLHEVLVISEFNAAVTQTPRLGLFGWHRNFLLLGLPLMKGLTVEQFKAVLAHELGHLSRGHARWANWIYRMRLIWMRLEATFERTPRSGAGLIRAFFRWYIPHFNAMSFPLARTNEYEADAASVQATSAREAAQALTSVSIIGSYYERKYWPEIHAAAKDSPQPAFAPFSGFTPGALRDVPASDLAQWRDAALTSKTSHSDTHPALCDRLKAIGAPLEFAPPSAGQGADRLLGAARARVERAFDVKWQNDVADSWRKFHEQTQRDRTRLAGLRADRERDSLDQKQALELAALEESVGAGTDAALELSRATLTRFPDSPPARFALAQYLLRNGDSKGVAMMESVIREDASAMLAGAELLRNYYAGREDHANAQSWQDRYLDQAKQLQAARKERNQVLLSDRFVAHSLGADRLARLAAELKSVKKLRRAYLVQKMVQHFPGEPLYILGVKSTGFLQLHNRQRTAAVVQAIREGIELPGDTIIIDVEGSNYRFGRKLRRVKRARIA